MVQHKPTAFVKHVNATYLCWYDLCTHQEINGTWMEELSVMDNCCDLHGFDVTLPSSSLHWAIAYPLITHKWLSQLDSVLIQHGELLSTHWQIVKGAVRLSRQKSDQEPKGVYWSKFLTQDAKISSHIPAQFQFFVDLKFIFMQNYLENKTKQEELLWIVCLSWGVILEQLQPMTLMVVHVEICNNNSWQ